jgi:hypothetical protein
MEAAAQVLSVGGNELLKDQGREEIVQVEDQHCGSKPAQITQVIALLTATNLLLGRY